LSHLIGGKKEPARSARRWFGFGKVV